MTGLRVLITNNMLAGRAGTELYVRDLALALLERGHTPIAYSPVLGDVADELRRATVPVLDDLRALGARPDLIHGHHHLETMTALLHFPGVLAVYFCHGWLPWQEAPPRSPRVRRYVAVDAACRDRLVLEHGIPPDCVRVILNFVDLARFRPRGPLPPRPRRALVFSNYATEATVRPVRDACRAAGIELDVLGLASGNGSAAPEALLGRYDLVFAKGRAALEALAVGTAVILCDFAGLGGLVTVGGLERLRPLNFGIRALRQPIVCDAVAREIARYDPQDAAEVSRRIRDTVGRDAAVDEILGVYREVLGEPEPAAPDADFRAASGYLRWLSVALRGTVPRAELDGVCAERDRLAAGLDRLGAENEHLKGELRACRVERDALQEELVALGGTATFRLRARLLEVPVLAPALRLLGRTTRNRLRAPG